MTSRLEQKRAGLYAVLVAFGFMLGGVLEARGQRPALAPFAMLQFGVNTGMALRRAGLEGFQALLVTAAVLLAAIALLSFGAGHFTPRRRLEAP